MEEVRAAALAAYSDYSSEEKNLVVEAFKSLASYKDGKASCKELADLFSESRSQRKEEIFAGVDRDGDGYLNLYDFITLAYTFYGTFSCDECGDRNMVTKGMSYSCVECIDLRNSNDDNRSYNLCVTCYKSKQFSHHHSFFLDNYLQLQKRNQMAKKLKDRKKSRESHEALEAALAYYDACSNEEKELLEKGFMQLDFDNDGRVSSKDFNASPFANSGRGIKLLDNYYMDFKTFIKSIYRRDSKGCCEHCNLYIDGMFYSCVECFDRWDSSGKHCRYDLCVNCYRTRKFVHPHSSFFDNYVLLEKRNLALKEYKEKEKRREEEEIRGPAMTDYKNCSDERKEARMKTFRDLDSNSDGKISYEELKAFLSEEGYTGQKFKSLAELDKDGDGYLDQWDFNVLQYMIDKRVSCKVCGLFIKGLCYSCAECMNKWISKSGDNYYVCPACYHSGKFVHEHSTFWDNYEMLWNRMQAARNEEDERRKKEMDEIRVAAAAYYENCPKGEIQEVEKTFRDLDADSKGKVSFKEFDAFYSATGVTDELVYLDRDGDGYLDLQDAIVYYYIDKTRARCQVCKHFINGMYYSCIECFGQKGSFGDRKTYNLCFSCYPTGRLDHPHFFLDNYTFLQMILSAPTNENKIATLQEENEVFTEDIATVESTQTDNSEEKDADQEENAIVPSTIRSNSLEKETKNEIDEIREAAAIYYNSCSNEEKQRVLSMFVTLDTNNDGKVSYEEFEAFPSSVGLLKPAIEDFMELDRDGDGYLDYQDAKVLYYMDLTREICQVCRRFIKGMYYTCVECFDHKGRLGERKTHSLCLACYDTGRVNHPHVFLDNYALLRTRSLSGKGKKSIQQEEEEDEVVKEIQMEEKDLRSPVASDSMDHTGRILLRGPSRDGFYHFPGAIQQRIENLEACVGEKTSLSKWHQRLGHASLRVVKNIISKFSLPYSSSFSYPFVCEACQMGKAHCLSLPSSNTIFSSPLELVFSDVWEPTPTLSNKGF
ncbi:PREDICTED: uncharacterized protein LOC104587812 isoform X2 [Nelumbo nucifera]|uniref:Uncharacterized protein LOC104587812 isoform X2 n=1 Tax=Nelumbo nucifera TaxID=4432 RepID=A0A1U7Z9P2_NELNU|nr:PREDICTED: uncharacterized protein LOC104587812 isoform X2 [Nelumbo nucifera]